MSTGSSEQRFTMKRILKYRALFPLIFAMVIQGCAGPADRLAEEALFPDLTYADLGEFRAHYIEKGAGEPLILIHGFTSSIFCYRKVIGPLSENFHTFAIDLKGFGRSEKPAEADYTLEALASDVVRFMDLKGIERAHLMGNSLGGGISMLIALLYPDRVDRLVLLDPGCYPMDPNWMFRVIRTPGLRSMASLFWTRAAHRRMLEQSIYDHAMIDDLLLDGYYDPYKEREARKAAIKVASALDFDRLSSLTERYPEISAEALIVWGEQDQTVPLSYGRRLCSDLGRARLAIVRECGHMPSEERPEILVPLVEAFLAAGDLDSVAEQWGVGLE